MDFTIDIDKNPWVNTIPKDNLNEFINNYLNSGFEVSKSAKITIDSRDLRQQVEDIKKDVSFSNNVILDKVNSMIDNYNNDSEIRNQTAGELKDSILKLSGKATCSATRESR